MKIISLLLIIFSISSAYAKVYKCILNGKTLFQETPCSKESRGGEIEVKPNIVSTKGLRQYMKQDRLPKKLREKKAINARKAKRAWMNGEFDTFSKQQKKLLKKKKRELKQREQDEKSREEKKSK